MDIGEPGRGDECFEGVIAMREHNLVAQRTMQPAAQLAATHRGGGMVDHRGERALRPGTERNVQLEVAARRRIEDQRIVACFDTETANVR